MILVYSDPKTGRSGQMELDQQRTAALINRHIGEVIEGSLVGLGGCKIKITGGADTSGFAMRKGIGGTAKRKMLKRNDESQFVRVTVRGDTVAADTQQVNSVITEQEGNIDSLFKQKETKQTEEKEGKTE